MIFGERIIPRLPLVFTDKQSLQFFQAVQEEKLTYDWILELKADAGELMKDHTSAKD